MVKDELDIVNGLKRIEMIPTFPNIVKEVMDVIENPLSSASDLVTHLDPPMVSEIMKVANSAYYGTRNFRKISSVEHAIAIIGFEQLSFIILQMPFISLINEKDRAFDRFKYISHSLITGAIGKGISESLKLGNPNEVYISGIMHDLGIIVLYRYFKEEWKAITSLMELQNMSRLDAEKEVLTMDHGYFAALLFDLWNIPDAIIEAVRFHHSPEYAKNIKQHVLATYIANRLAKRVDLKDVCSGLNQFVLANRGFIDEVSDFKEFSSAQDELRFFENIYDNLKGVLTTLKIMME